LTQEDKEWLAQRARAEHDWTGFPRFRPARTMPISRQALRRQYRWKLPDALQAAIAVNRWLKLVTRNTRDFDPALHSFVLIPYTLT
ncbi:MAG: hypothetical protein ACREX9_22180, partial [Gammaproteobacteria bacterium]